MKILLSCIAMSLLIWSSCKRSAGPDFTEMIDGVKSQKDLIQVTRDLGVAMEAHPEADGGLWYGKLARQALRISRTRDSEALYIRALRDYGSSASTLENFSGLAELYSVYLEYDLAAQAICCGLSGRGETGDYGDCCPTGFPAIDQALTNLRADVFDVESGRIDSQKARHYIALCQIRALLQPEDTSAADHLNEAAKVAKSIRAFPVSLELYDWIITDYLQTPYGPKAMFLKAFTLENDLNDLESARIAYEAYLKSWPQDDFADDARILLDNLGKDPSELIRQFQQQQQ
jgi:hypothetical protein